MKKVKKSNSGFTLIELIIAMAILAFLMTAVSAFMGSGVMSFRKAKADQTVNTAAQTVYDQLADTVMAANDIYVYAYKMKNANQSLDFTKPGEKAQYDVEGPYYYVKDLEAAMKLMKMDWYVTGTTIFYYTNLSPNDKLYVISMRVDKATDIDMNYMEPAEDVAAGKYKNQFTKEVVQIQKQYKETVISETGTITNVGGETVSNLGKNSYNVKDTERNTFTFDEKNLYYEKEYAFMTQLNDTIAASSEKDCLYSQSFSYLVGSDDRPSDKISGCLMHVDVDGGALSLDFEFNDKNMTYTGKGMLNIRNSYVLKAKK